GVAPSWSEKELALLRTHYAEGIEYVISLLPGRSRKAIFRQASLAAKWHLNRSRFGIRIVHDLACVFAIAVRNAQ
ncbi:TPA_asm: hypothetical protein G0D46_24745, partial [Salmonella enterica subsp. enterica serovar Java]|nr:hypothetical protein [Salmonella enterica subsp. enterica serovar Java]